MTDLKRDEIKYVRDISKSAYKKDNSCYICETDEELQFHHFYSMTLLWEKWKKLNSIVINNVEDILEHREQFKIDHHHEIYNETITLCKFHHMEKLHKVYGKVPALSTAMKQKRWCDKQKEKYSLKKKNENVETGIGDS
jgi:hypothetical protein